MISVLCVKWGEKYNHEYVNILYNKLKKYPFYCYTDNPDGLDPNINIIPIPKNPALKVWWNKLRMFSDEFPLKGKIFYIDLDIQINSDPIPHLKNIDWSKLTMVNCHWKSDEVYDRPTNYDVRVNSSVLTWESNPNICKIWDYFMDSGYKDYFLRKYVGIDRYIVHEDFEYNTFPIDFIQSMKYESNKIAPITTFEEYDDKGIVLSKSI